MQQTELRKDEHIRINLEEDVSFGALTAGFERYRFEHQALPELNLEDIETRLTVWGRSLRFPLLIASMTGGSPLGGRINRVLAEAAQAAGVGLGLGSMRAALEDAAAAETFAVRRYAPDVLLCANLGAVQLNYGYGVADCQRLVELIEADALILHLNPLQEALQPEGQTRFAGLLARIAEVCRALSVPVIVKEVGWGLSPQVALRLLEAGVAALDVAGAGGTSWSQVELYRHTDPGARAVAAAFRDWGTPTAEAVRRVRAVAPQALIVASGGLRDGIDIAKSIALGADLASLARPFLKPALTSVDAVLALLRVLEQQLRVAMFAAGARDLAALRQTPLLEVPDQARARGPVESLG